MFAVIKTGGKQYRVAVGDQLKVEKLAGEAGDIIELTEVLMIGDQIGAPLVDGAVVAAEIVEQGRARKVIAFKKRRRQNSRRTIGHRQHFSLIEVTELLTGGKKPSKKAGAAAKAAAAKKESADKASADKDAAKDAGSKGAAKKAAPEKKTAAKADKKETKADAKKADAKVDDKPKAAAKKDDKSDAATSAVPLFKAPKGDADDLTKIKGIGPVAKDQLAEQGITQFAQVAKLTDKEVVIIDEAMPFSADQISDWRAQAKEMIKG